jgi:hypothetical protein
MNEPAPSGAQSLPIANAGSGCGDGAKGDLPSSLKDLLSRYNVNDYAASVKVFAVKPEDPHA